MFPSRTDRKGKGVDLWTLHHVEGPAGLRHLRDVLVFVYHKLHHIIQSLVHRVGAWKQLLRILLPDLHIENTCMRVHTHAHFSNSGML